MTRASVSRNLDQFPTVKKANSKLTRMMFGLMGFGAVLPFLLPESSWLVDTSVMHWLSGFIPSASKMAGAALVPNLVHAYIVITLSVSFCFGVGFFCTVELGEFVQAALAKNASKGLFYMWCVTFCGVAVFALLLYFFYVFPGTPPSGDPRGSRGQLIVSLMMMTKPGLAIFGGFICGGIAGIWFMCLLAIYQFFHIPFLAFQSKR